MKAIICTRYGSPDVLQLREIEKPAPKEDEILIRVLATSINSRDMRMMRADPFFIRLGFGFFKLKNPILGVDLAGRVEAVGSQVKTFKPGDAVFGCAERYGGRTFAEFVCAGEDEIALKPAGHSFEEAAAVPLAAITALQGLRDRGNIQAGQKVAIQGASGGVGSFAVQLAKYFGAEVTAVCSTRNLEMARNLGADQVIDYKKEDFTRSGRQYNLILAANGYHSMSDYLRALAPEGICVVAGGSMRQLFPAMLQGRQNGKAGGKKVFVVSMKPSHPDLLLVKELLETGKLIPVIDGCYPLEQTAEAMRYIENTHARGKVVITMKDGLA